MAKRPVEAKPAVNKTEDAFVELMLVAADFVRTSGGMSQAKKALEETGQFIARAGNAANAAKALEVLENLKSKIGQ